MNRTPCRSKASRRPAFLILGAAGLLTAALPACMTIKQMAPPVEPAFIAHAGPGADLDQLRRGRRIYVTRCTKCHTAEPVNRYSMSKWHRTMTDMSEETKLSEQEDADVMAYIQSAHRFMTWLDQNPEVKKKVYASYTNPKSKSAGAE